MDALRNSGVRGLHLSNNKISTDAITKANLEGFVHLKSLSLKGNPKIKSIGFQAFKNSKLDYLNIENCNVEILNKLGAEHLSIAHFSNNNIREIEKDVFQNMLKLKELHLDHNSISNIDENAFQDLTSLELLKLSHNVISNLHENSFNNLKKIRYVDLSSNLILQLPKNILSNNGKIRTAIILLDNPIVKDLDELFSVD